MKPSPWPELLVATLVLVSFRAPTASALTIETVPVGNPGNADAAGALNTPRGGVAYEYRIGKYEVTLNQYREFLNAVGATDTYGLWSTEMANTAYLPGIARGGMPGSYTYSVIGSGNSPVTFVSWFDAARFANWLHNGQPTGAQDASTTEQGAYTLNGAMTGLIPRNSGWNYGLPSDDEWAKAAYHQPAAQGGPSGDYWYYPTRGSGKPNSRNGSGTDTHSANWYWNDEINNGFNGGYAVSNSTTFPPPTGVTDVGAFSVAASYYGTFDQAGNVGEWTDAVWPNTGGYLITRGGSWLVSTHEFMALSDFNDGLLPQGASGTVGFRIVMNPANAPPVLNFSRSGNTLTFSWTGNFKLQFQNNSLSGIWQDYPAGSISPVIHNINPAIPRAFFRLSTP